MSWTGATGESWRHTRSNVSMIACRHYQFYNRRASAWDGRINWTAGVRALVAPTDREYHGVGDRRPAMRGTRAPDHEVAWRAQFLCPVLEKNVEASADQNRERPVGGACIPACASLSL
jgi:hypothetical protein